MVSDAGNMCQKRAKHKSIGIQSSDNEDIPRTSRLQPQGTYSQISGTYFQPMLCLLHP